MSKVTVVTDSTAYIPEELTKELGIKVIPLQVIWGEDTYKDNVDIKNEEFYTRLKTAEVMPTTSQPSPQEFIDIYKPLLDKGQKIISIHISAGISGTVNSAVQAKELLETDDVMVLDSQSTAMAMGFAVMSTAKLAKTGASFDVCKNHAENAVKNIDVYFMVDTLEFLHRGGRIGGAAKLLGSALDLKPILSLVDGKIESVEKVRTKKKALRRIIELTKEKVGDRSPVHFAVLEVEAAEDAESVKNALEAEFDAKDITEMVVTSVSPVIGTHTGPGVIAIAYLAGL